MPIGAALAWDDDRCEMMIISAEGTYLVSCDVRPLAVSGSAKGGRGWRWRDPGPVPEACPRPGLDDSGGRAGSVTGCVVPLLGRGV